jgi:hypothetical protein
VRAQVHGEGAKEAAARWQQPVRFFFEDSLHDYHVTKASFDGFVPWLVEGGVILAHDVGCCANEFPGLVQFIREWSDTQLKENFVELTPLLLPSNGSLKGYAAFSASTRAEILRNLALALDRRPEYRALHEEALGNLLKDASTAHTESSGMSALTRGRLWNQRLAAGLNSVALKKKMGEHFVDVDCKELCSLNNGMAKMKAGYTWSVCPNTRIFQKVVKQVKPMLLALPFVESVSRQAAHDLVGNVCG